ncbi:MAG: hypothetical protein HQL08_15970, partial [Nitrospirae bacterium]|nr:hypothetical protein [Nitrospirota bacterium]
MNEESKKTVKPSNRREHPVILSPASPGNSICLHITCLVLLIMVIYANTIHGPFQWDEHDFIVTNPAIRHLSLLTEQGDELYGDVMNRYVGYLTFALNGGAGGSAASSGTAGTVYYENTYTVTPSAGANGIISPSTTQT